MQRMNTTPPRKWSTFRSVALIAIAIGIGSPASARADEAEAKNLLKAMSDYLAGQTAISFAYDSDLDAVTGDLQKLKFASSGTVSLSRPDKIRVTRTGGFADVEMVFDGKRLSVLGKDLNRYAEVEAPGTIDQRRSISMNAGSFCACSFCTTSSTSSSSPRNRTLSETRPVRITTRSPADRRKRMPRPS